MTADNTVEAVFVRSTKDGFDIPCKIWQAKDNIPKVAAFYVHGGAFASGNCDSHPQMANALSQTLGITIITATFRCGEMAPRSTGITLHDLKDVAKYFQEKVESRNVPFGVIGSSSGGYFALELITTQIPGIKFDFCIPICPVAHPRRRYSYLRDCVSGKAASNNDYGHHSHDAETAKNMMERQLSYWETEEAMEIAGEALRWNRIAAGQSSGEVTPTLLIMGTADKNVPMHVNKYVQAWATRTILIGNAGHEIQNAPPVDNDFKKFLGDMDSFLANVVKNQTDISIWR
mmetsp:Transcript_14224/g.21695  ORF Transcript_14224/g.21695 Transcript_14224/m.21695 type:complete len:289 (-) Transcript_14224:33-899(-)|eukprot:CAMPEP_0178919530 /NCGR_PEP_ID=MMETSP0786-20121207/14486_1 /TAXON_ID=186022 /ORGANISM="Thalassionema frauenfeldii, Strain CCMP 1798" /LENGTH=288 /DNA_ID=CAMNT_0020593467 /DNA_START=27 /DNA_END=893 /DNA_ORIENTATION=+